MAFHYATTCLPSPLAFFFHQLPAIAHEAEVAMCLFAEIPATLLLVLPLPKLWRVVGLVIQLGLQVLIQLTGNYTFFNLLTALLCLSVIDDDLWASFGVVVQGGAKNRAPAPSGPFRRWLGWLFQLAVMYLAFTGVLSQTLTIDVSGQSPGQLAAKFAAAIMPDQATTWHELLPLIRLKLIFGTGYLQKFLNLAIPLVLLGASSVMAISCGSFLWSTLTSFKGKKSTARYLVACCYSTLIVAGVAFIFLGNVPNYTRLTSGPALSSGAQCAYPVSSVECASTTVYHAFDQPWLTEINTRLRPWAGASSYGLFRSMTGVGSQGEVARPELIVEGFDGKDWLQYHFLYKPGDLSRPPPWVAPHQPRLDWQMWFAALGNYQRSPWLLHWIYKQLVHSPTARDLIDDENSPYADVPPRALRVKQYAYDFSLDDVSRAVQEKHRDWSGKSGVEEGTWWRRHYVGEWLQPVETANLEQFVSSQGYPLDPSSECLGRGLPAPFGVAVAHLRSHTYTISLTVAVLVVANSLMSIIRCLRQ
jgi:hypothetical protein